MLLGNIQCRAADRRAGCADQLPRGPVGVPGQLIHLGCLPKLPFGRFCRAIHQVIGCAAGQRLLLKG